MYLTYLNSRPHASTKDPYPGVFLLMIARDPWLVVHSKGSSYLFENLSMALLRCPVVAYHVYSVDSGAMLPKTKGMDLSKPMPY